MRNMSFALTKQQFKARTKTVTRRLGWENLKVGELLAGCEKCQGIKPGEKIVKMGVIEVMSVRRERLDAMLDVCRPNYGVREVIAEGFPVMRVRDFVKFFCATHKVKLPTGKLAQCTPETVITRVRFRYV